mgnify:CR=1 FL=1|tara:strand:- start:4945 stop:5238 length:294 start_codon:yes stop_codon:yes gene_type:complete
MDFVSISIAVFFLVLAFVIFQKYLGDEPEMLDGSAVVQTAATGQPGESVSTIAKVLASNTEEVPEDKVKEVVYTQDFYPWYRSTRWWNYDGWLYQKP